MTKINLTPSPGIAIIEPLETHDPSAFATSSQPKGRTIRGTIIAMGADDKTVYNIPIKATDYGKVGDIVWFLHYYEEGGVDIMTFNDKQYYVAKWQDFRGIEK